jgi:hypothetical protein
MEWSGPNPGANPTIAGYNAWVDVMITIFCDFCQFSVKIGVFLKNQCHANFLAKFSAKIFLKP